MPAGQEVQTKGDNKKRAIPCGRCTRGATASRYAPNAATSDIRSPLSAPAPQRPHWQACFQPEQLVEDAQAQPENWVWRDKLNEHSPLHLMYTIHCGPHHSAGTASSLQSPKGLLSPLPNSHVAAGMGQPSLLPPPNLPPLPAPTRVLAIHSQKYMNTHTSGGLTNGGSTGHPTKHTSATESKLAAGWHRPPAMPRELPTERNLGPTTRIQEAIVELGERARASACACQPARCTNLLGEP